MVTYDIFHIIEVGIFNIRSISNIDSIWAALETGVHPIL